MEPPKKRYIKPISHTITMLKPKKNVSKKSTSTSSKKGSMEKDVVVSYPNNYSFETPSTSTSKVITREVKDVFSEENRISPLTSLSKSKSQGKTSKSSKKSATNRSVTKFNESIAKKGSSKSPSKTAKSRSRSKTPVRNKTLERTSSKKGIMKYTKGTTAIVKDSDRKNPIDNSHKMESPDTKNLRGRYNQVDKGNLKKIINDKIKNKLEEDLSYRGELLTFVTKPKKQHSYIENKLDVRSDALHVISDIENYLPGLKTLHIKDRP